MMVQYRLMHMSVTRLVPALSSSKKLLTIFLVSFVAPLTEIFFVDVTLNSVVFTVNDEWMRQFILLSVFLIQISLKNSSCITLKKILNNPKIGITLENGLSHA